MTAQSAAISRRLVIPPSLKLAPDRRRHKRFSMVLFGRFMRQSKQEYPCKLIDISVGGAGLMSPVVLDMGEPIIAYFDQLGGLQGKVVRFVDGGFAIEFTATQHKREKLAAQITWLINRDELGGVEDRRHERIALKNHVSTLKLQDGSAVDCRVLDVSLSGAMVATSVNPEIGSEVVVGKMRGRVVRKTDVGIGVEFLNIQEPEALRRHFD